MKKLIFTATILAFIGFPVRLWSQEKEQKEKQELVEQQAQKEAEEIIEQKERSEADAKQSEEIVIRKSGDKEINLKVEIIGDKITVNGKPLAEFKDNQITINKRKMIVRDGEDVMAFDLGEGAQHFNFNGDFNKFFKRDDNKTETRTYLGILTEKSTDGVSIVEVVKESPAEKAGLLKGDVITKIGDVAVTDPATLSKLVGSKKANEEIKIYYKRGGKQKNMKATLGEKTEKATTVFSYGKPRTKVKTFRMPTPPTPPTPPMAGFYGEDMNQERIEGLQELRLDALAELDNVFPRQKKLGLKIQDNENDSNVKVIGVDSASAAEKAGLKKDDLIIEIGGTKITNTDEAREQLHAEEGKQSYTVKALRDGKPMTFEIKIPKRIKTANL